MTSFKPEELIFYEALDLCDAFARADYISKACGSDTQLQERVERLVRAYSDGEFLESPIADVAATELLPLVGEMAGDTIGPYKLLEQIGEGGMGLVFMAEQSKPLRRRVALKIIKPGLDTRAVIARFEAERQALALMDHPNIARVYDAGATGSGRPYFVMELVRGVPITEYCIRHELDLRARLELVSQVCQAVQSAHQKGIIHRDLKPTNILVAHDDSTPVPKVIDFGVAKATNQQLTEFTLFTHFAQVIGTPLYMSPEQAELNYQDIDTRSDVYSLGVVLYELLTGTTPFDAERLRSVSPDEMRRIIREEEPPQPSTRATIAAATTIATTGKDLRRVRASVLKGDLDWIVMKALEKDRRRRYESPSALAADIARHLKNEPIEAFPPTRRHRLVKFARRNRIGLLTTGAVLASLLFGFGASVWQAMRATSAERRANVALEQARRAVDDMYTGVAENWLESQGSLSAVQRELLHKALDFYKGLAAEPSAAADIHDAATSALLRVGRIHARLGDSAQAEKVFKQAIERYERLVHEDPDRPGRYLALVDSRTNLARLYETMGRTEDMIEQSTRATKHLDRLRQFDFSEAEQKERLAKTLSSLSTALSMSNQRDQARESMQFSLELWKSLIAESPESLDYRYGLALAKTRQGTAEMWWRSDDVAAERHLREADALLTALLTECPSDVGCRRTLSQAALTNLGTLLSWRNRSEDAIEYYRRSLTISEALAKDFPDDEVDQAAYLKSLLNLAGTLTDARKGEPGEVVGLFTTAHDLAKRLVRKHPNSVPQKKIFLDTFLGVSRVLHRQGKRQETLEFCQRSLPELSVILEAPGTGVNLGLANDCLSLLAALHIDFADHAAAADTLRLYGQKRFDRDYANLYKLDGQERASRLVSAYEAQVFVLLKPAFLYEECARLAKQDASLSATQLAAALTSYSTQGHAYREEGMLAIDAWVDALDVHGSAGAFRAAHHGERHIVEMLNWKNDQRTSPTWRTAEAATCRNMVQILIEAAARQMAEEPAQYVIAQLLIAAPDELRNDELALKLARQAVKLVPASKEANFTLGWALCRTGQWQATIDLLTTSADSSSESSSAMAMALWQLGRKNEARQTLEKAARQLKQYKKEVSDNRRRDMLTFPEP